VIAFRRRAPGVAGAPDQIALVALNFSDAPRSVQLPAPAAGTYREVLDRPYRPAGADVEQVAAQAGDGLTIQVPSNYGQILVSPPPAGG
jgi:hypothetical protein